MKKKRVLYVDDDEALGAMVRETLERRKDEVASAFAASDRLTVTP